MRSINFQHQHLRAIISKRHLHAAPKHIIKPIDRKKIDQLPRLDGLVNLKDGTAKSREAEVGVEGHRRLNNEET
jgi:hypothetical protein